METNVDSLKHKDQWINIHSDTLRHKTEEADLVWGLFRLINEPTDQFLGAAARVERGFNPFRLWCWRKAGIVSARRHWTPCASVVNRRLFVWRRWPDFYLFVCLFFTQHALLLSSWAALKLLSSLWRSGVTEEVSVSECCSSWTLNPLTSSHVTSAGVIELKIRGWSVRFRADDAFYFEITASAKLMSCDRENYCLCRLCEEQYRLWSG